MLPLGQYSRRIAPTTAMATTSKATIKKCTTFPGRFDGHGNAPVLYHDRWCIHHHTADDVICVRPCSVMALCPPAPLSIFGLSPLSTALSSLLSFVDVLMDGTGRMCTLHLILNPDSQWHSTSSRHHQCPPLPHDHAN